MIDDRRLIEHFLPVNSIGEAASSERHTKSRPISNYRVAVIPFSAKPSASGLALRTRFFRFNIDMQPKIDN
jgi:hypothetical protein